jgi:hypothetical protein
MKETRLKISPELEEFLVSLSRRFRAGPGYRPGLNELAGEMLSWLYRIILLEEDPGLTESEWHYLYDAYNGHLWQDIDLLPEVMLAVVLDADRLQRLGEKWGVDAEALARKLAGFCPGQRARVLIRIRQFWARA